MIQKIISQPDFIWALRTLCQNNQLPFHPNLVLREFLPPFSFEMLSHAAQVLGFNISSRTVDINEMAKMTCPFFALIPADAQFSAPSSEVQPNNSEIKKSPRVGSAEYVAAFVVEVSDKKISFFLPGLEGLQTKTLEQFSENFTGYVMQAVVETKPVVKTHTGSGSVSFGYAWFVEEIKKHQFLWREVALTAISVQLIGLALPWFIQFIIDKAIPQQAGGKVVGVGVSLAILIVFGMVMGVVRQNITLSIVKQMSVSLSMLIFDHLWKLPFSYFEHQPVNKGMRQMADVNRIHQFIATVLAIIVLDLPFIGVFVFAMLFYSPFLTFLAICFLVAYVGITLLAFSVFQGRIEKQFRQTDQYHAFVTESFSHLKTVKLLHFEPQLQAQYSGYLDAYLDADAEIKKLSNFYFLGMRALEQIFIVLILAIGFGFVSQDEHSNFRIGTLIGFLMLFTIMNQLLARVALWLEPLCYANFSIKNIKELLAVTPESYSPRGVALVNSADNILEITDLGFQYSETSPKVCYGFNLQVEPGQCISIVGSAGSGKTTIIRMLQKFHIPTKGQIKVAGQDIAGVTVNDLRKTTGVVEQDANLFSGTIYDNLIIGGESLTTEKVVEVCKAIDIHDFIQRLPQGYKTEVGEQGMALSICERQCINIARVLLREPTILVIDGVINNLDAARTESLVKLLNQIKGKATILLFGYKTPEGLAADKIINLDRGIAGKKETD